MGIVTILMILPNGYVIYNIFKNLVWFASRGIRVAKVFSNIRKKDKEPEIIDGFEVLN